MNNMVTIIRVKQNLRKKPRCSCSDLIEFLRFLSLVYTCAFFNTNCGACWILGMSIRSRLIYCCFASAVIYGGRALFSFSSSAGPINPIRNISGLLIWGH